MARRPKPWLVLDVSYLCWRAYHAHKGLSFEDVRTGVLYGVLRDLQSFERKFASDQFVFAFDHGRPIRKDIYAGYKAKRDDKDPDKQAERAEVRRQMDRLRKDYLPDLGYCNIFYQDGYEADDVIASVVKTVQAPEETVIVTGDADMYQLLERESTCVFHPREGKTVNRSIFMSSYGVQPEVWRHVKAVAGCGTDDVPGCKGVGEISVCKYLRNELAPGSAMHRKIKTFVKTDEYKTMLKLVSLPLAGCRKFRPAPTKVDKKAYTALVRSMGMKSLDRLPSPLEAD